MPRPPTNHHDRGRTPAVVHTGTPTTAPKLFRLFGDADGGGRLVDLEGVRPGSGVGAAVPGVDPVLQPERQDDLLQFGPRLGSHRFPQVAIACNGFSRLQ
jgi:hypothetical protein